MHNSSNQNKKFALLVVLDGWGIAPPSPGNAITEAKTPNMNRIWASFPHTQLGASGESVGLPPSEVGNTETGHLNLGAGRIVYQDLARINMAIKDKTFDGSKSLQKAAEHVKTNNSNLHIMGLVSPGGVHSSMDHLYALLDFAQRQNIKNVFIHAFTDGRDSSPKAGIEQIEKLEERIKNTNFKIASVMGRYWAMDRDQRWDRTQKAYDALTKGKGDLASSASQALEKSYEANITDEFVAPTLISDDDQKPLALIKENDAVIFFNFRIDRPRQLTKIFLDANIPNLLFITMTEYDKSLTAAGAQVAFPPEVIDIPLGRMVSLAGLRQLRAAESEKEKFVTHYFNGLREMPFPGEEKLIVPSQKVATYDLTPEMSAPELTEKLLQRAQADDFSFILVNYANADMVGHTGNIEAAIKAIETLDECIGKLTNFILAYDGVMLITADHGNAEEMLSPKTGGIDTEHSRFPVPMIVVGKQFLGKAITLPSGILADVAPTIAGLLELEIPGDMQGKNLLAEVQF
jgi:2,3-bisphosphoglycerate-independent phosphoglycerate mutase